MNVAKDWQDYEILDMANGEKLEVSPTNYNYGGQHLVVEIS